MLHRVDMAFLFSSVESLRPERREREQIFRVSQGGWGEGGGERSWNTKIPCNKPSNISRNEPKLL